jgi:hypothetical protein
MSLGLISRTSCRLGPIKAEFRGGNQTQLKPCRTHVTPLSMDLFPTSLVHRLLITFAQLWGKPLLGALVLLSLNYLCLNLSFSLNYSLS